MKEGKDFEIRDLESRLARIVEWVRACDTKTSFLLALVGVMMPLVLQSEFLQDDMMASFRMIGDENVSCMQNIICYLYVGVVLAFGLSLLITCWKFMNVLYAKRTESLSEHICGRKQGTVDKSVKTDSLLHFHHISTLSYEHFKCSIVAETSGDLREDLLSQIYINSCRCEEKYSYYNDGVRYLVGCGILLIIAYILHILLFGA
ncbi:MAG: hypothetical protein IJ544_01840 [Prevotella sp.]|nr:hypothetical protein [Prevotella sp.]